MDVVIDPDTGKIKKLVPLPKHKHGLWNKLYN